MCGFPVQVMWTEWRQDKQVVLGLQLNKLQGNAAGNNVGGEKGRDEKRERGASNGPEQNKEGDKEGALNREQADTNERRGEGK